MEDINFVPMKNSLYFTRILSRKETDNLENSDGYFIDADENEIRKILEALRKKKANKKIAIMARDEEFNRRVLESLKFDYLVSPEINSGKDGLKQRSSGINHVLAKIAKERGVSFLVPLNDFEGLNRREKSIRIARIIQNVRLCRKAKCPIKLASFSDKRAYSMRERGIIGTSWGMSSQQAADSCVF